MDLLLTNATWFDEKSGTTSGDIRIVDRHIFETGRRFLMRGGLLSEQKLEVNLEGHYVYPGLINSHDHLEMNLYPHLGTPPYQNYKEWSADIYHPTQTPIREIEATDKEMRLLWGGLKNLISGVTTVVHHNPWSRFLSSSKFPINVWSTQWAHSLAFDEHVVARKKEANNRMFVLHAAEGVDEFARQEIHQLMELKCLDKNTILVHGVGVGEEEERILVDSGSSVIWCPASNMYMFNKTAHVPLLRKAERVVLGSDSTLTGSPTLLDEMHTALKTGLATEHDIFRMTGSIPRNLFGIPGSEIQPSMQGDFLITPKKHPDPIKNLFVIEPKDISAVIVAGRFQLSDPSLDLPHPKHSFTVGGRTKFSTVNVKKLKGYFEESVGSQLLQKNPLWNMIAV